MPPTPILVSQKDAASMLGISVWSIQKLVNEQKVKSVFHGSRRLVLVSSIEAYAAGLPEYRDKGGAAS